MRNTKYLVKHTNKKKKKNYGAHLLGERQTSDVVGTSVPQPAATVSKDN